MEEKILAPLKKRRLEMGGGLAEENQLWKYVTDYSL